VTDDDQAILDANAVLYAAFNARDVEAMEALWATSAPVSCVHPGWNVIFGRVEVMDSWRAILTNPDQPRIVAGGAELRRYGDCAVVICRELVAGNPLASTNVLVREDGRWKLVHHQSGPVLRLS